MIVLLSKMDFGFHENILLPVLTPLPTEKMGKR
jgi:hypothetical protein